MKTFAFTLFLIATLVTGCSNVQPLQETKTKNVHVRTKLQSPDGKIRADLDVFAVIDNCEEKYIGSVELDKQIVDIGLPTGTTEHISYIITRDSLSGGRRTLTLPSSLTIRPDYDYYVELSWVNGTYDLKLFEAPSANKANKHPIPLKHSTTC